ncbi:glycoside hydrolase family 6 protein [Actinoallomurus sp. NPDC050550]|uniref:glycoside hydrolase family 6 protein n=1 Tax=Actinoallomurus sp. NPDC050550 TaxID=3154937 RepID=UPI0034113EE5
MAHSRTSRRITGLAALGAAAVIGLNGACSPGQAAGTVAARAAAPAAAAGSPIDMTSGFYVDPDSNPAKWVRDNPGDARAAQIKSAIADKPTAGWFGDWSGDIGTAVSNYVGAADAADKLPVLVAYNIPGRDCSGESKGGSDKDKYEAWISAFAGAIGTRPAVVVIEPDALAQLDCLPTDSERQFRLNLLEFATEQFKAKAPNTWAYLDAGNAKWIAADTMAQRLESAGVHNVRGFAVNVSNYYTTDESESYGTAVNASLSSKVPFIVDTSRNGNGSKNGEWCNPAGRKLGGTPQVGGGAEMLLWVKVPGDSDGSCGVGEGIPAGQFSPDLAMHLINGS